MNLEFKSINKKDIHLIKHLWEKLRDHHYNKTIHFQENISNMTFDKRVEKFVNINEDKLKIEIVSDIDIPVIVGYCVGTIDDNNEGEVDSLFVEDNYRGNNLGYKLMDKIIKWMDSNGVKNKKLSVLYGNEDVFKFYEKFGFYPRITVLKTK